MRKRIGRVLSSRAFLIVLSFVAATVLWFIVEYTENETVRIQIENIPVTFINAELVTDRNLVVTDRGSPTISATFEGPRAVMSRLSSKSIHAVVDLVQVHDPRTTLALPYKIEYDAGIDAGALTVSGYSGNGYTIISVENIFRRDVLFKPQIEGNLVADGYLYDPIAFTPEFVTVSGPESVVRGINEARVLIQRENLTATTNLTLPFTLIGENGDEIQRGTLLNVSSETAEVTIPIHSVKTVPLKVELLYGAGATEQNTEVTISPASVTLSGDASALTMNAISLGTIDLTSFDTDFTGTFPLVVSDELTNLSGVTEATVTVTIRNVTVRSFSVTAIEVVNETAGYSARIIPQSITVRLRGPATVMPLITRENIRIIVDLAQYGNSAGMVTAPATITVAGYSRDSVGALGTYTAAVEITKDNGS